LDPDSGNPHLEEANDEDSGTKDRTATKEIEEDRKFPGEIDVCDMPQGAPLYGKARIPP
jgi:hypothetical protein